MSRRRTPPRAAWPLALLLALAAAAAAAAAAQPATGASAAAAAARPAADSAADPALEARVNAVAAELRCLVCQNQSLADSHAGLAIDLKNQVREQLRAGRSAQQVIDYMTERYGDFVRYRPPVKPLTALLWAGPLLMVLGGGLGLARALSRQRRALQDEPADADAQEQQARAARLLGLPPVEPAAGRPGTADPPPA